ncbi:hypothetical protein [Ottowia testudinis]|uniref:Uncharacterized protein n=1 Tax=Ottowia testudinis TaxID=2816950 RepID=A0A975CNN5_9BURK|nr:hypothetical protein [Ottowia testudinis]QTD46843.1 hypothetical protein J1M35_08215 [Ottowia testudinis]
MLDRVFLVINGVPMKYRRTLLLTLMGAALGAAGCRKAGSAHDAVIGHRYRNTTTSMVVRFERDDIAKVQIGDKLMDYPYTQEGHRYTVWTGGKPQSGIGLVFEFDDAGKLINTPANAHWVRE